MSPNPRLVLTVVLALAVVTPASTVAFASPASADGSQTQAPSTQLSAPSTQWDPSPGGVDPVESGGDGDARSDDRGDARSDNGTVAPANGSALDAALRAETRGYALSTVIGSEQNTTNYLDIADGDVEREGYARTGSDAVGAIERNVARIRSNYTTRSFSHAHETATESETVTGIRSEVTRLESEIEALSERHRTAIDRYTDGTWTSERFLRELSTLDAEARGIDARFEHLEDSVILPLPTNLRTEIQALKIELVSLRGPVRAHIGDAIVGDRDPFVVYTAASRDGLVTAYTDDQLLFREAFLGSNRADTGPNRFVSEDDPRGFSAADQRAKELYPWAYAYGGGGVDTFVNTTIYQVSLDNPHGILDVYLDGRTTDAFREIQRKGLDLLPTDPVENTSDGVHLRINRTHGTGPMELTVTNETGAPLNATVTVNGYHVGATGADGRLWTVTPSLGVDVAVETADGRTVTLTYSPD